MASSWRSSPACAFRRRRRRSTSFDGDFGLEDLFQEQFEPEPEEEEDEDDEMDYMERLFFDEEDDAAWVAQQAERRKREAEEKKLAEEEKKREAEEKKRREQKLELCRKKHMSVINSIRKYDPKAKTLVWTRFPFENFAAFDLDEESSVPPMRYTDRKYQTECHMSCSANIFTIKIVSSDVGFPINVYGTVIARDSLDHKCVYLFRCHRRDSQLIKSEDKSLILIGPARGLVLEDFIFLEVDLKIKGERGQDKQLSKGLLEIDGRKVTRMKIEVMGVTCASRLSTVEVKYAVVKKAVEATVEFQVLQGDLYGKITARTSNILREIVLYKRKAGGVLTTDGNGIIKLRRHVIAVCLTDMLIFTIKTEAGSTRMLDFTPALNGADDYEFFCGAVKLRVKITWSIIDFDLI